MKKILLVLLSISLFTGCENEPLEGEFGGTDVLTNNQGNGNGTGSDSSDLTLDVYELDTDISFSFFGLPFHTITRSDANISNNIITSSNIEVSVNDSPFESETQTITRNGNGQITSDISVNASGQTTNEYIITYTSGEISQITYDYFEDDLDDYIYNFTYNGNVITRTEVGSSISTVFTLNTSNKITKKESFDGTASIQVETITYNSDGNCSNSITTGETNNTISYSYDGFESPLKTVFDEQYILSFLNDDYSDEIGYTLAQFHASKNWNGVNINGAAFNFDLQYNASNRISTRNISYNFEGELTFVFSETFNYVN